MTKYYAIQPVGFEYDDSTYYASNYDRVYTKLYHDKDEARKMAYSQLQGQEILLCAEGCISDFTLSVIKKVCSKFGCHDYKDVQDSDDWEFKSSFTIPEGIELDYVVKMVSLIETDLQISFFEIIQMEI